jgi:hypothetical protein
MAADHLQANQEQHDTAGDLKSTNRDAHLTQQRGAGEDEENKDSK